MKYKIGDRVRVVNDFEDVGILGRKGKIIDIFVKKRNMTYDYIIQFDDFLPGYGHCGYGGGINSVSGEDGYCRFLYEDEILKEIVDNELNRKLYPSRVSDNGYLVSKES